MKNVEVSNEDYEAIRDKVLTMRTIKRLDVMLAELEVNDLKTITIRDAAYGDMTLKLSKFAVGKLAEALGISQMFVKTINDSFGDNKQVLNSIVKAVKQKKAKSLVVVYNEAFNEVTNIYPSGSKLISDKQYFDALEGIIAKTPGAYLRNIAVDMNGDLKSVIANPNLVFDFGGKKDESFTGGMTLDLDCKKMKTSFFTERLVCTNGMTVKDQLCSMQVNTNEKVPGFLHAVLSKEYSLGSVEQFRKRINTCYHSTASLREVLDVDRKLQSLLGSSADALTAEMSATRLKMQFGEKYMNSPEYHKFLFTDVTLWELVNEITAVSSRIERDRLKVSSSVNLGLQVLGGERMFKTPDLPPNTIRQLFSQRKGDD